jgi:hypothetical protein
VTTVGAHVGEVVGRVGRWVGLVGACDGMRVGVAVDGWAVELVGFGVGT